MGSTNFGNVIAPLGEVTPPQHDNIERGDAGREGNGGRA